MRRNYELLKGKNFKWDFIMRKETNTTGTEQLKTKGLFHIRIQYSPQATV